MEIEVPANTTATVVVPTTRADAVTESGKPAREANGVAFVRAEQNAAVYRVGSGKYVFEADGAR